ncbi:MAG: hypothetical protein JJU35_15195 [Balneolales bacterium]|nr:hypothetical protein [Balneolales bacterium]
MKQTAIGINQRIPLDTLHTGLISHLENRYSDEYIVEQLRLSFKGENRLKKAKQIVSRIIRQSEVTPFVEANSAEITQAIKNKQDRSLILIALLNGAYPFSFTTLQTLGKYLSVQELINRQSINKSLAAIYGGNRATANALDSVLPMFIEAGLIRRKKIAVFEHNKQFQPGTAIATQAFIQSFKANTAYQTLQSYQLSDPYFLFLNG